MVDVDKITRDAISKGGVLALLYFDLHGSSKEVLQDLSSGFIQKILKEHGVIYALGEIDEPMPAKEGKFYSCAVEVKILTTDFSTLTNICAAYSPFSLEILRPDEIRMPIDKAHDLLISIAATTFDYKKYIIEKVSTKAGVESYRKSIEQKIELGKRLSEKKGEKNA